MVTEDEAKEKLCPILPMYQGAPAFCQGSRCMAWRQEMGDQEWAETDNESFSGTSIIRHVKPEGDGWINHDREQGFGRNNKTLWRRPINNHGFCGIAALGSYSRR